MWVGSELELGRQHSMIWRDRMSQYEIDGNGIASVVDGYCFETGEATRRRVSYICDGAWIPT